MLSTHSISVHSLFLLLDYVAHSCASVEVIGEETTAVDHYNEHEMGECFKIGSKKAGNKIMISNAYILTVNSFQLLSVMLIFDRTFVVVLSFWQYYMDDSPIFMVDIVYPTLQAVTLVVFDS